VPPVHRFVKNLSGAAVEAISSAHVEKLRQIAERWMMFLPVG
jgi:hypothetical protein